ncbi:hypothetical protein TeGR_g8211, partial [Tetraparma gracilis]
ATRVYLSDASQHGRNFDSVIAPRLLSLARAVRAARRDDGLRLRFLRHVAAGDAGAVERMFVEELGLGYAADIGLCLEPEGRGGGGPQTQPKARRRRKSEVELLGSGPVISDIGGARASRRGGGRNLAVVDEFNSSAAPGSEHRFPADLSARDRALVHERCEQLGLHHRGEGEGAARIVLIQKPTDAKPFEADSKRTRNAPTV